MKDSAVEALLAGCTAEQLLYLDWQRRWLDTARPDQVIPDGNWTECGARAGRGWGKTRVGAEWIARAAYEAEDSFQSYVIAPTQSDVRFTCFEGESGLLSIIPPELVENYNRTDLVLTLRNGKHRPTIRGFSAEKADRLRGPQGARAWCDELAAWGKDAKDTWDMMQFGLRLGKLPQVVWTTTPRPVPLVRELSEPREDRILITGATYDNKANLPTSFFRQLESYEGTKIGRQEIYGELIDPEEAGIVKRSWFNLWPSGKPLPKLEFIVMSLDTAYTEKTTDRKTNDADPTACGVWGLFFIKSVAHVLLLDCWEEHLGLPDLLKRVKKEIGTAYGDDEDQAMVRPLFGSSKPGYSGRKTDMLLIEDKGSGISLRQMLAQQQIEAHAYNPGRADKLSRLHIVSPIFAQRRIWVPESENHKNRPKSWCEGLIGQLCSFIGEGSIKHDDHVDQTTQALRVLLDKGFLSLTKATADEKRTIAAEGAGYMSPSLTGNPYDT